MKLAVFHLGKNIPAGGSDAAARRFGCAAQIFLI